MVKIQDGKYIIIHTDAILSQTKIVEVHSKGAAFHKEDTLEYSKRHVSYDANDRTNIYSDDSLSLGSQSMSVHQF